MKAFAILEDRKLYLQSQDGDVDVEDGQQLEIITTNDNNAILSYETTAINEECQEEEDIERKQNENDTLYNNLEEDLNLQFENSTSSSSRPFYFLQNRIYKEEKRTRRRRKRKSNQKSYFITNNTNRNRNEMKKKKKRFVGKILEIRKGEEFLDDAVDLDNAREKRTAIYKLCLNNEDCSGGGGALKEEEEEEGSRTEKIHVQGELFIYNHSETIS